MPIYKTSLMEILVFRNNHISVLFGENPDSLIVRVLKIEVPDMRYAGK